MTTVLTVIHVVVCFFLVVIVLLQHGKGADMGATFGGSSQTVFGSDGPLPLMNKVTTGSAIVFMVTSVSLAYLSAHMSTNSVMKNVAVPKPIERSIERAPATEVEQPDVELGGDKQDVSVKENADSIVTPAVVEQNITEETIDETASKTVDTVKDVGQPAATEQEKITEPEKKE